MTTAHFPDDRHRAPQITEAEVVGLRNVGYLPRRRRWPGVLAAALIGAGVAAAVVSSYYDSRSIGQRIDASLGAVERGVDAHVAKLEAGVSVVASQGGRTGERVVATLTDAGITASVKTALAADPALSALQINVDTHDGVVTLSGPAPDEKARDRAAVLAAAPDGVHQVDNRLVVLAPVSRL